MSIRYTKSSNNFQLDSNSLPMSKPSQTDIDQMIQYARPTNRDLTRRDISRAINSLTSSLFLKVAPYTYNNGISKELLCLHGTVICHFRGSPYNIPIEIWLQQDHPNVSPLAYVKPTLDMYVSPSSRDVQPDGTIVIPYLRSWRHPNSDLITLINAMSEAFSQSPPVYSSSSGTPRQTTYPSTSTSYPSTSTSYPTTSTSYPSSSTPYPTNPTPYSSIPTPYSTNFPPYPLSSTPYPTNPSMPMPTGVNPSYSYPQGYPQTTIPADIFRESLQTAALNKIRYRFDETIQVGNAEIESLKKAEQDLTNGEKKLQSIINELQQQQIRAQNYITNLNAKKSEISEAAQKISSKEKENSVKDDALIIPAPIYKQLLQAYAEEHAIQDLLYYLADGLRKQSIGLDTYLKHVRELSRKQFMLRATMRRCRQVANLPIK